MSNNTFQAFGHWMVSTFGFEKAVFIEDIISNVCIYVLGMLTMALISSCFILRLHSVEDFGKSKVKLVQMNRGNKSKLVFSIPNIWVALETLLFLSFSPFCRIKRFTSRDARRTRRFVIFIEIVVAIILVVSFFTFSTVLEPI